MSMTDSQLERKVKLSVIEAIGEEILEMSHDQTAALCSRLEKLWPAEQIAQPTAAPTQRPK